MRYQLSTVSRQQRRGFTLLELLVVISIIGVLIGITTVSFSTAQQRGRDAKRRGDIKAMQNAFEQYYAANNGQYGANCTAMANLPSGGGQLMPGGVLPTDPKNGWTAYNTGNGCSTTGYCVCADLEGTGGNATAMPAGGTPTQCQYGTTNASFYCVSNLQ